MILRLGLTLFICGAVLSIPTRKTSYDENEAKRLLNLAAGAYADMPHECVNRTFSPLEGRQVLNSVHEECDVVSSLCSGYVVQSDKLRELIVVFRGTKTKIQLLYEGWQSHEMGLDFFDMGNVNQYFLNAHLILWPPIEKVLRDPRFKDYSVAFTGHSLGGALAALGAARTVRQGLRQGGQVRIITFGEPRVGSAKFAKNFDQMIPNSYRVVFRRDIVPHLPACHKDLSNKTIADGDVRPCNPFEGTQNYHHGTEIWYPDCMTPGCKYLECTGLPKNEDFGCSDKIKFHLDEASSYIWDHRNYFGVKVTSHGKSGCDGIFNKTETHNKAVDTVISGVNWLARRIGLN